MALVNEVWYDETEMGRCFYCGELTPMLAGAGHSRSNNHVQT